MSNEIELLKSQIQDLVNKVKELEDKSKKEEFVIVERVSKFSKYYAICGIENDEHCIASIEDQFDSVDTKYYNSNNYFRTREEAEKYLKRFLLELKVLRARDKINGDWKPNWTNGGNKFCIDVDENDVDEYYGQDRSNLLSFETREKRARFRELIADEEIIEFLNF